MLGPEHPHTLTSLHNMANLLKEQGKLDEAEELFKRAVGARERVLGAKHPKTIKTKENLAKTLTSQGKYMQATAWYIKSLKVV